MRSKRSALGRRLTVIAASAALAVLAVGAPPVAAAPAIDTTTNRPGLAASATPALTPLHSTLQAGSSRDCGDLASNAARLAAAGQSGVATCTRASRRPPTLNGEGSGASVTAVCGAGSIVKRNGSCIVEDGLVVIYLVPSGDVIGSITFTVESLTTLNYNALGWSQSFHYRGLTVAGAQNGPAVVNTSVYAEPLCLASCTVSSSGLIGGSALPGFPQSATGYFNSPPSGYIWNAQSGFKFWFANPAWVSGRTNPAITTPGAHRCDDALPGLPRGCAYPSIRPVHEIGSLRYPTYARHIGLALSHGEDRILTRTTNESISTLNYNTACPPTSPSYPRPTGYSCDEYPFRSTYNGAASQSFGRTFLVINFNGSYSFSCQVRWLTIRPASQPGGYSACMVPIAENSGGGSDLGNFYYTNRVIDGDQFEVRVIA